MARVEYKDMIKCEHEIVNKNRLFEGLDLVPLETYKGQDTRPAWDYRTPMANGFYKPYTIRNSDKIEKIVIGELHYMNRANYCALNMTASDAYDIPIFACEFDESAPRLSITIDLMPLADIAVHHDYRKKYLDPLAAIWREYRDLPGFVQDGRCLIQRRYAPWPWARASLSPFPLDGKIEEPELRQKIIEAIVLYGRVWLDLVSAAEPVSDSAYKAEMLARKRALQQYYRERDPGGEVIKKLFGEERCKLFVSLVF